MFVVSETHVKYLMPAVLDDVLEIETVITHRGKSSLSLDQKAYRKQTTKADHLGRLDNYNSERSEIGVAKQDQPASQLLCSATIRIGWINVQTGRPARIPSFIQEIL